MKILGNGWVFMSFRNVKWNGFDQKTEIWILSKWTSNAVFSILQVTGILKISIFKYAQVNEKKNCSDYITQHICITYSYKFVIHKKSKNLFY